MELSVIYIIMSKLGILGYIFNLLGNKLKFEYILYIDYFILYYLIMLSLHQFNPILLYYIYSYLLNIGRYLFISSSINFYYPIFYNVTSLIIYLLLLLLL